MHEPKQDKNASTKTDRQQTAVKNASRQGLGIATPPFDPLVQQVSRMGNAPNPSAHAAILNRAPANQQSSNQQLLLQLQQQYGNPYVNQVLQLARGMGEETLANATEKPLMQAKLTIGSVGDKYEREADRTAQQVVQRMDAPSQSDRGQPIQGEAMPEVELQKKPEISTIQRQEMLEKKEEEQQAEVKEETDPLQLQKKCGGCEKQEKNNLVQMKPETATFPQEELPEDEENEELMMQPLVQRQPAGGGKAATPKVETSIQQKRGRGEPLSDKLREPMEQAFGKDFSGVRVHADVQSDQINRSIQARAFTTGQDIFFRQGEYASGSKQGQELLAHELTHVVQQNGNAIKAKSGQGVTVSESSPETTVQKLCSNCEKEEKAENALQAKEISSGTLAVAPEPEVSISQVTQPAIQRVFDDFPRERREPKAPKQEKDKQPEALEETAESDTSDCDQQGDANKAQPEAPQGEQKPEKCPSEKEDKGEEQSKPEKTKPLKDKLSEKPATCVRQEQNPILQVFAFIPTATPNLTATPATTTVTKAPTPQQNLQATGEAASPEVAAEKAEATMTATEAQGQLRTTDAEVARLGASKINFKLPQQEGTNTDNNAAALEEQRTTASSMASNFFTEAAWRIQTVTGLGQSISARINGGAENAKASVMSTVQQQKDAVAAQINQQRTQVQNQAQASTAEIQQQYQATITNISQRTAEVSQRIQTEYSNAFHKVNQGEIDLLSRIDQLYIQTFDQYIAAGDRVGNEATAVGDKWAKQWESERSHKYDDVDSDTDVEELGTGRSRYRPNPGQLAEQTKNSKLQKKASTAKEVAKQYKEQVTEEATKQANNLVKGKAKDIKGICCGINELRKQLQKQQAETLKAVTDFQQQAVSPVVEAQTELTASVNQTLQATLQSLNEQETAQLKILQGYADRQVLAIERDAQKAIASLQKGVNQAANKLLTALQDHYSEFQGMEAPNLDELSITLAEILGQFDSSIATVQGETQKGIAASVGGIKQGEQQAVGAVGAIAQTGIEESAAVVEEARTSFANLDRGITDTFNKLRDAYTEAANKFVEDTAKGLAQITQNSQNPLEQIYQKLSEGLQKSVTQIEEGLRDSLKCLETDIQNYAAKAVEDEPWWKTLLKALVFIAIIVVAIVLAPIGIGFVAGAVGGGIAATIFASVVVGAALGAGLGALSQIANNAIDGKNLMDGVGKAALAGAIGGAIGGFGGGLGGVLGNVGKLGAGLSKTLSKFGIETGFDTLGNIFGDLAAGNPITWEGVLMGAAIGAGIYVATTKGNLRRLGKPGKKILSFQQRSSEAGMRGGAFVAGKIKTAFGGKVETSPGRRSGVDVASAKPPEAEVKAPKTSVPGSQGVDIPTVSRPDVDVSTPSTRPDVGTETLRGLKPDTDVPMTRREQEILENTAPKDGDKLTPEELKIELKVAGRSERKPINEGEYVEEIELPNGHKLKRRRSDGGWCRFSDPSCFPKNIQPGSSSSSQSDAMDVDKPSDSQSREPQETSPQEEVIKVDKPTPKLTEEERGKLLSNYPKAPEGHYWVVKKGKVWIAKKPSHQGPKLVYDEITSKFVEKDSNVRKRRRTESDEDGYEGDTEQTTSEPAQKRSKEVPKQKPTSYQERRADAGVGTKVPFLKHREFRTERRLRRLALRYRKEGFGERNIYVVSYKLPNGKRIRIVTVSQPPRGLPKEHEKMDKSTLASLTKPGHSEAVHHRIEANYRSYRPKNPEEPKTPEEPINFAEATRRYEATTREQCGSGKGGASCRHLYPSKADEHYYGYPYSGVEDHLESKGLPQNDENKTLLEKVLDNITQGRGSTSELTPQEKKEFHVAEDSATWARQNDPDQNPALKRDLAKLGDRDSSDEYTSDEDETYISPGIRHMIGPVEKLGKADLKDIPAVETLSKTDMTKQEEWVEEKQAEAQKQKIHQQTKQSETDVIDNHTNRTLTIENEQFNVGFASGNYNRCLLDSISQLLRQQGHHDVTTDNLATLFEEAGVIQRGQQIDFYNQVLNQTIMESYGVRLQVHQESPTGLINHPVIGNQGNILHILHNRIHPQLGHFSPLFPIFPNNHQ